MSEQGMTLLQFEADFAYLEQNRMNPQGYRKEAYMKKITLNHVAAISHAETYIVGAITSTMESRARREIEDDLFRLTDIKKWLLKAMYQPGLPLTPEIPEEPKPHGDTSSS